MNNQSIGIFDSGIGGITVLHQAITDLPEERYIYYADIDNVPYGLKTKEEIKQYVDKAVEFMVKKRVKAIVIACNTATSIDIENLRKTYDIPIIGMEPAVKLAIKKNEKNRILVIATPVTIQGRKLNELLERFDKDKKIDLLALPELVKFAEREEFDTLQVENYLKEKLKKFNLKEYSEIVLGCTHFNYFKPVIRKIFPSNIEILDGNKGTINRLSNLLKKNNLLADTSSLKIEYYFSGRKIEDKDILNKIQRLHKRIEEVK